MVAVAVLVQFVFQKFDWNIRNLTNVTSQLACSQMYVMAIRKPQTKTEILKEQLTEIRVIVEVVVVCYHNLFLSHSL